MGLGLRIHCLPNELGGRTREQIEHAVSMFAAREPADPLLRRLVRCEALDDRLLVRLHPSEESVEFFFEASGNFVCAAKTSTAGPGYHAFLLEWLENLGTACRLPWIWPSD